MLSLSGTLMLFDALLKPARAVTLCALTGGLFGCASEKPPAQPSFYDSMAKPDVQLDANAAASMISGYRRNNGLNPVSLDPQLMQLAETQAQSMAGRDKLDHSAGGVLAQRVKHAGYEAKVAVENVSAGYHTLAEAFSGWRDSPPHRAIMLKEGVTKMGIAAVYAPSSKYRVFWALVLASPDDKRK
jgi:uncharacterized protein YkwD